MTTQRLAIVYDCLFPYTTGGGERMYRAFAEAASTRGRDVTYLTARQWNGATPELDTFTIEPITPKLRLYSAGGVRRPQAALQFAWAVFRGLRRRRHDIDAALVSGLPVLNVFAARAALLGSGIPLAVDYLEVWGRAQWIEYAGAVTGPIAWALQRLAIGVTPIATCHSQLSARRLRREGFRGQLVVSPGLIADDAVSTTPTLPEADATPYVLYAGRHIQDKRVESLPAAVAAARASVPGLRLVILGEGPSSPDVALAIAAVDGAAWTDQPGFVDEARLGELMDQATCLVNPSRREGYGLVVVEAAASGTPVVLVADEGNAAVELISEGENGFVAASPEPHDLALAIVKAVDGGSGLRERTRLWYEQAVQTRTIRRSVDRILAAFDAAEEHRREHRSTAAKKGIR